MGNERQRRDGGDERLVTHVNGERRSRRRGGWRDVAHGDRRPEGRPIAARGDDSDPLAGSVSDCRALAGGQLAVEAEADPKPRRSLAELAGNAVAAGKIGSRTAALGDGEDEAG